jgi:hypothetical protein
MAGLSCVNVVQSRGFDDDVNCVCCWNSGAVDSHRVDAPCSASSHRRRAAADPHPGIPSWMRKTVAHWCEHQMHCSHSLPGGGSKVKPCHSDAVEAWGAPLSGSTPARETAPRTAGRAGTPALPETPRHRLTSVLRKSRGNRVCLAESAAIIEACQHLVLHPTQLVYRQRFTLPCKLQMWS